MFIDWGGRPAHVKPKLGKKVWRPVQQKDGKLVTSDWSISISWSTIILLFNCVLAALYVAFVCVCLVWGMTQYRCAAFKCRQPERKGQQQQINPVRIIKSSTPQRTSEKTLISIPCAFLGGLDWCAPLRWSACRLLKRTHIISLWLEESYGIMIVLSDITIFKFQTGAASSREDIRVASHVCIDFDTKQNRAKTAVFRVHEFRSLTGWHLGNEAIPLTIVHALTQPDR